MKERLGALEMEEDVDDYRLILQYVWITVGTISIRIHKNVDGGCCVAAYKKGEEDCAEISVMEVPAV